MKPLSRRVASEVGYFAGYLLLTIAVTWPVAINLSRSVSDLGDPLLTSWILDWTSYALLHHPLRLFDAPMFYPAVMPLAMSEHLVGIVLFTMPFHLAGLSPVTIESIAMLLGFALSGYGAFVLARLFTRAPVAAFVAGIFYAFVSFKYDHLAHLQIISSGWLPLILAALVVYWRRPSMGTAALFAGAFAMNGLSNIYYLLFAVAAVGISILFLFFAGPRHDARFWIRLAGALVVAGLILLPFLRPYRAVSQLYEMKRPKELIAEHSVVWSDWLAASTRNRIYGRLTPQSLRNPERQLFPGLFGIFLTLAGLLMTPRKEARSPGTATDRRGLLWALDGSIVICAGAAYLGAVSDPRFALHLFGHQVFSISSSDIPMMALCLLALIRLSIRLPAGLGGVERRSLRDALADSRFPIEAWVAMLWIAIGILGSFGTKTFFYAFLFQRIEAYQAMREPGRWAIITYVGMVVWMAIGAGAILDRHRGALRKAIASGLVVLALIDIAPIIRWEQVLPEQNAAVYRWLAEGRAEEQVGPAIEWPVDEWLTFRYLLGSTTHRVPLMNGSSGFYPPVYVRLLTAWNERRYDDVLALAEENGVKVLIIHAHWMGERDEEVRRFLRQAVDNGRLEYLRRFDHDVEGDFVFAVRRNLRRPGALRAADVPNGAGNLPLQTLARFLDGKATHNDATIGRVTEPHDYTVRSPVHIRGWASSPYGITRVDVLVKDGLYRYQAALIDPPSGEADRWIHEGKRGFELVLRKRPHGVPRNTEFQIEITDGRGRRTRLEDRLMEWM